MSAFKRLLVLACMLALAAPLSAAVIIRLATAAPAGTIWDLALADLGATWKKDTAGRVSLRVTASSSSGGEKATIKKMELESLDAGLLTAGALGYLDKSFNVFTIPFFFENDDEELAVQKKLEPMLEKNLQAKGYHLVAWGTGGWVQIFSRKRLKTLADVKASRLYVAEDDSEMVQWYTRNGFHAVPLSLGEFVTQLKLPTGQIDTAPDTPYLALMMTVYEGAKYMLNVHIAPLVGAIIIKSSVWNQLSPEDREKMTAAARSMESSIRSRAAAQDSESITAMKAKGLEVVTPDGTNMAEFRSAADDMAKSMRGSIVPEEVFTIAQQERDAVRKRK